MSEFQFKAPKVRAGEPLSGGSGSDATGKPSAGSFRPEIFLSRWGLLICVSLLTIGASVMAIDSYGRLTLVPSTTVVLKPPPLVVATHECLEDRSEVAESCLHRNPASSLRAILQEGLASPLVDLGDHGQRRLFREWSSRASEPGTPVLLFRRGPASDGRQTFGVSFGGQDVVGEVTVERDGTIWRPVSVSRTSR